MTNKVIMVTGGAGFIGSALIKHLLKFGGKNLTIISVDNLNEYYDVNLKLKRIQEIEEIAKTREADSVYCVFKMCDVSIKDHVDRLIECYHPVIIVHLAAQAGVTESLYHPDSYIKSNIEGFYNILEACRKNPVKKLLYASSSSVYGDSVGTCYDSLTDGTETDHPLSLYAMTKKSNELMAYTYSHLYGIPTIGMRFFTVYGESSRPDMFCYKIAEQISQGKQIRLSSVDGKWCERNFTYIGDVIKSIMLLMDDEESSVKGFYDVVNICNENHPSVFEFANTMLECLKAVELVDQSKELDYVAQPVEKGNTHSVFGSSHKLEVWTGFKPYIDIKIGIEQFVYWYKSWISHKMG